MSVSFAQSATPNRTEVSLGCHGNAQDLLHALLIKESFFFPFYPVSSLGFSHNFHTHTCFHPRISVIHVSHWFDDSDSMAGCHLWSQKRTHQKMVIEG